MGRPVNNNGNEDGTRETILNTATDLFGLKGFDGVHMRDIAARIRLTMPAIYYHFKSKEMLYEAVITTAAGRFRRKLEEATRLSGHTRDRLVAILSANFRIAREMPALIRLFYQVLFGPLSDTRKQQYGRGVVDSDRLVRRVMEEGIAAGEIRPGIVNDATMALMGAITAYNISYLVFGIGPPSDADARRIVDLVLDGAAPHSVEHEARI
jgi:AcrR family transcriptional regulator